MCPPRLSWFLTHRFPIVIVGVISLIVFCRVVLMMLYSWICSSITSISRRRSTNSSWLSAIWEHFDLHSFMRINRWDDKISYDLIDLQASLARWRVSNTSSYKLFCNCLSLTMRRCSFCFSARRLLKCWEWMERILHRCVVIKSIKASLWDLFSCSSVASKVATFSSRLLMVAIDVALSLSYCLMMTLNLAACVALSLLYALMMTLDLAACFWRIAELILSFLFKADPNICFIPLMVISHSLWWRSSSLACRFRVMAAFAFALVETNTRSTIILWWASATDLSHNSFASAISHSATCSLFLPQHE